MANPFHVTDFFSHDDSPALSLSLAGIFRHGGGEEEAGKGWLREEAVEIISSENSAPTSRTRTSDEDESILDIDKTNNNNMKRRKKYHRHTAHQIKQMELLFKESPHPDDRQRQQLSKQLALSARQIKFWFQNRRTQIKAMQERNENSLIKTQMERIREENNTLKEAINKLCCPNCGCSKLATISSQEDQNQNLRIQNARLKDQIQKLRSAIENDTVSGGIDRSRIMKLVDQAREELTTMATLGEPLWVRSIETGREILNYVEYQKRFPLSWIHSTRKCVEVSRETRVVLADLAMLLQCFMDVNQWREMFPCIISKAAILDVINDGELRHHRDGAVHLMVAELQMLTPTIPAREVCFVRHCKQLSSEKWVIVDVSIDNTTEDNKINDIVKFSKRPSGCIIEDLSNGSCKVTWVEHLEYCQNMSVPTLMYRQIINDETAFGARRWVGTLRQQCERLVYLMATNVPAKDSNGRKSILRLAHRMTRSFCLSIGASSLHKWIKLPNMKDGDDIRVSYRKNLNDPDEPKGVILCATSSVWLHVSHLVLADFLTDASRRHEWDIMWSGSPAQSLAKFAKGQDKDNSVTLIQAARSENDHKRILQDSTWNGCESLVVYAPVDSSTLQSAVTKGTGGVALLPSGFCILPDGVESRAMVVPRSKVDDDELGGGGGGCFLTLAFQVLASNCPTDELTMESLESVSTLVSRTLTNIRTSLHK